MFPQFLTYPAIKTLVILYSNCWFMYQLALQALRGQDEKKISKTAFNLLFTLSVSLCSLFHYTLCLIDLQCINTGKLQQVQWPRVDNKHFNFMLKSIFTLSTRDKCSHSTEAGWPFYPSGL